MRKEQQATVEWLKINKADLIKHGLHRPGSVFKVDYMGNLVRVMVSGRMTYLQMLESTEHFGKVLELWNQKKLRDPWRNYKEIGERREQKS